MNEFDSYAVMRAQGSGAADVYRVAKRDGLPKSMRFECCVQSLASVFPTRKK